MGLTDTLRTLQNLGLTVEEEVNIPLTLPEGKMALERLHIGASPTSRAIPNASSRRCARSRKIGRPTIH